VIFGGIKFLIKVVIKMSFLCKNRFHAGLLSVLLLTAFSLPMYNNVSARTATDSVGLEETDITERGLPELIQAVENYVNTDQTETVADAALQIADEQLLEPIGTLQTNKHFTKSLIIKFIAKILKNSAISSAAMTELIKNFTTGHTGWGIATGVTISILDAAISIYNSYSQNMENLAKAEQTAA
jgi:hypothetical protein